jgi:hypothetical protein
MGLYLVKTKEVVIHENRTIISKNRPENIIN